MTDGHFHDVQTEVNELHTISSSHSLSNVKSGTKKPLSSRTKVVILGISVCLLYVGSNTCLNYMTTFFPQYSSIVLFIYGVVVGCLGLIAPLVATRVSVYILLCACAICIFAFCGLSLYVLISVHFSPTPPASSSVFLFVAAAMSGIGNGILWTSWTVYMNSVSTDETRGTLSGLFYAIFYVSTPVGNGLSALLFAIKFEKWQVLLVLNCFAFVGVIVMFFVPANQCQRKSKTPKPPTTHIPVKQYFIDLVSLFKVPSFYPLAMTCVVYQTSNAFMQACFTLQLPADLAGTIVGIGFAIGGVMSVIASLSFGRLVDKVSLRASLFLVLLAYITMTLFSYITLLIPMDTFRWARVVMWVLSVSVYGFAQTGIDVNSYVLCVALCQTNPVAFLQLSKFFGYVVYGINAFVSEWLADMPHIYILMLLGFIFLLFYLLWTVDIHKFSFSKQPVDDDIASLEMEETRSIRQASSHHSSIHSFPKSRSIQTSLSTSTNIPSQLGTTSFVDLPELTPKQFQDTLSDSVKNPIDTESMDPPPVPIPIPGASGVTSRPKIRSTLALSATKSDSAYIDGTATSLPSGHLTAFSPTLSDHPTLPTQPQMKSSLSRPYIPRSSVRNTSYQSLSGAVPSTLATSVSRSQLGPRKRSQYMRGEGDSMLAMYALQNLYASQTFSQHHLNQNEEFVRGVPIRSTANAEQWDVIDEEGDIIADDGAVGEMVLRDVRFKGGLAAVKIIASEGVTDGEKTYGPRLLSEGISNKYFIRIREMLKDQSQFLVMMDYANLPTLTHILQYSGGSLPVRFVGIWMRQLLTCLSEFHAHGYIHRDIKSENVFLHLDGQNTVIAQLSDYGLLTPQSNHTAQNGIVGTPLYLAPEIVYLSPRYSDKSDIWAVGVLMFYLLCGKSSILFSSPGAIQSENPPLHLLTSIDALCKDAISSLLQRNAQKRLSAQDALNHPFFKQFEDETTNNIPWDEFAEVTRHISLPLFFITPFSLTPLLDNLLRPISVPRPPDDVYYTPATHASDQNYRHNTPPRKSAEPSSDHQLSNQQGGQLIQALARQNTPPGVRGSPHPAPKFVPQMKGINGPPFSPSAKPPSAQVVFPPPPSNRPTQHSQHPLPKTRPSPPPNNLTLPPTPTNFTPPPPPTNFTHPPPRQLNPNANHTRTPSNGSYSSAMTTPSPPPPSQQSGHQSSDPQHSLPQLIATGRITDGIHPSTLQRQASPSISPDVHNNPPLPTLIPLPQIVVKKQTVTTAEMRQLGLVGLENRGLVCYLNTATQALFSVPLFRQLLLSHSPHPSSSPSFTDVFSQLFRQMTTSANPVTTRQILSPFFDKTGWPGFNPWVMCDTTDFTSRALTAIRTETKNTHLHGLIQTLFTGSLLRRTFIPATETSRPIDVHSPERFLSLPIPLISNSLETAIRQLGERKSSDSYIVYTSLPPILIVNLQRWKSDATGLQKNNDFFSFPTHLDFSPFVKPLTLFEEMHGIRRRKEMKKAKQAHATNPKPPQSTSNSNRSVSSRYPLTTILPFTIPRLESKELLWTSLHNHFNDPAKEEEWAKQKGSDPYFSESKKYSLVTVSVHSGTTSGGHYYAYTRPLGQQRWFLCDDSEVREVTEEEAVADQFGGKNAQDRIKTHSALSLLYVQDTFTTDSSLVLQQLANTSVSTLIHQREEEKRLVEQEERERQLELKRQEQEALEKEASERRQREQERLEVLDREQKQRKQEEQERQLELKRQEKEALEKEESERRQREQEEQERQLELKRQEQEESVQRQREQKEREKQLELKRRKQEALEKEESERMQREQKQLEVLEKQQKQRNQEAEIQHHQSLHQIEPHTSHRPTGNEQEQLIVAEDGRETQNEDEDTDTDQTLLIQHQPPLEKKPTSRKRKRNRSICKRCLQILGILGFVLIVILIILLLVRFFRYIFRPE
ncbi:putative Ubiquitin carboxyl-terminal hydrolase 7 [Blattamonas nauphoetae]|uniref:Ubiquitin carboxyl-terminal hydrolase 7 n=1 Tax=Blattamonas nauphoetae TaxID=2049346 RepID=A0ABQ9X9Q2_9EUKA|nr:putative Ubiquitin carboxyl-terminal hydrolase 7 [Blattamonas nauphoetae]